MNCIGRTYHAVPETLEEMELWIASIKCLLRKPPKINPVVGKGYLVRRIQKAHPGAVISSSGAGSMLSYLHTFFFLFLILFFVYVCVCVVCVCVCVCVVCLHCVK